MNIDDMVRNWDDWGEKDPMWSILTCPDKAGGRWTAEEFFATGRKQIEKELAWLDENGISVPRGRALDFGCGVGRLTNALAEHFDEVHGIDVSSAMIDQANELSRHPEKARFFHNPKTDLSDFAGGAYDFIYTQIVLQHIPTAYQEAYVAEFMRLLAPGGVALFQTLRAIRWRAWFPDWLVESIRSLRNPNKEAFLPMYGVPPQRVKSICARGDGILLDHRSLPAGAHAHKFEFDVYCVRKQ